MIKNVSRFWLAIAHVSAELLFRQAAAVMEQTHSLLNQAKLPGIKNQMVGKFTRVVVGAVMRKIGNVFGRRDVWGFGLSSDTSTHRRTTFCNVLVNVASREVLQNVHLVAMLHFERHTAISQVQMLRTLLGATYSGWVDKLLGVISDDELTIMGHISGVHTQLANLETYLVLQVWCVRNQMDLIVKAAAKLVHGAAWKKTC